MVEGSGDSVSVTLTEGSHTATVKVTSGKQTESDSASVTVKEEEEEEDLRKEKAKAAAKAAADATQIIPAIGLTELARELTRTMPRLNEERQDNQNDYEELFPGEDFYYNPPGQPLIRPREGE